MNIQGDHQIPPQTSLIATQATPIGRGSVATLLLDGSTDGDSSVLSRIEPLFRPATQRPLRASQTASSSVADQGVIRFGHWNHAPELSSDSNSNAWEEVVISISNHSISDHSHHNGACEEQRDTGSTRVEVQCHGGDRAANSILQSLESVGFRILTWTEWLAKTKPTFEREHTESLSKATTQRTALLLLRQGRQSTGEPGLIEREVNQLIKQLRESEHATSRLTNVTSQLQSLVNYGQIGTHLTVPWQIAVVGAPNVGKSSLVNALVGFQRAIVYDQPGTTRDELETSMALDGWPMQVWDTAGLRETTNEIEGQGIVRATERLQQADLILHIRDARDANQPPNEENQFRQIINEHANTLQSNVLDVWNKIDLVPETALGRLNHGVTTSATEGTGLDELKHQIVESLTRESIGCDSFNEQQTALLFTARQISLAEQALALCESDQLGDAIDRLEAILR